jgi:hypothetical protein
MDSPLIKAANLRTKEGVEFLAFFDFDGNLRTEDNANWFVDTMGLITSVPVTVSFQDFDRQAEWRHFGYRKDCREVVAAIAMRDVRAGDVALLVQNPEHEKEKP